ARGIRIPMGSGRQLDPFGRAGARRLICFLLFLALAPCARSQQAPPQTARIAAIKALYDGGHWDEVIQAIPESPDEPADLTLYRGLALAQLKRWAEAEKAFALGRAKNPRDKRFPIELAGVAYRESRLSRAKSLLQRALALDPGDDYANHF